MKKITKILSTILSITMLIAFTGCGKETKNANPEQIRGNNIFGGTSGGESGNNSLPTRLSANGIDYLVNNGKLLISGNGTVTKEAIASISPEFNEIDFERGTFDIGDDAFNGYKDIIKVQFRNNVYNIGARAFQGTSLPLVCFGTSIESIGNKAFADCCIDYVLINNDYIFKNFNSRYDFGEVAITADNVYVYQDSIPFDPDPSTNYAQYNTIAGDYLVESGLFDTLAKYINNNQTLSKQEYQYDLATNIDDKTGFILIYGTTSLDRMINASYNAQTNVLEYYSDVLDYYQTWQDRGVVFYGDNEYLNRNSNITVSVPTSEDIPPGGNSGKSTGSTTGGNSPTPPKQYDCTCSTCGGSGKKDCTSCDGGYTIDYETGTYMGYGSSTREVRKQCSFCGGQGTVKCFCCPNH